MDLIQEGNMGLMKAANNFNIEKGTNFSTYATWKIHQAISRALKNIGHEIRKPIHAEDKLSKFYGVVDYLRQLLEREPQVDEIAKVMNISVKKVGELYQYSDLKCCSLDAQIPGYEDSCFYGIIPDKQSPDPLVELERKNTIDNVHTILAHMDPKERIVLEMRFGIETRNSKDHTLQETGDSMHLTRERIRQIQAKAEKKIRKQLSAHNDNYKKKPRL